MDAAHSRRITLSRAAKVLLAPYVIAVALIVWLPAADASRVTGIVAEGALFLALLGLPFDVGYPLLEFLANVVLFLPLGALVKVAWPEVAWWRVALLGFAASALIEGVQLALPSRFPSVSDLVANTSGAAVGWVLARTRRRR